jgi:hypothetical protein
MKPSRVILVLVAAIVIGVTAASWTNAHRSGLDVGHHSMSAEFGGPHGFGGPRGNAGGSQIHADAGGNGVWHMHHDQVRLCTLHGPSDTSSLEQKKIRCSEWQ